LEAALEGEQAPIMFLKSVLFGGAYLLRQT
jgi:hypothetical protein